MTLACQWEGPPATSTQATCPKGKVGFSTASEAHWYVRRHVAVTRAHIYRCDWVGKDIGCGQYHWTSQAQAESKRRVRTARKRASAERSDAAETAAVHGMTEQPGAAS